MAQDRIATHTDPVWRDRADFVIHAEASDGLLEQLWAKECGAATFEICCIPFFLRDLHLGDLVETEPAGERQWMVSRVLKPSGYKTFRAWFGESSRPECQAELEAEARARRYEVERSSENLLAFSAQGAAVQELADLLWAYEGRGELIYETGQ